MKASTQAMAPDSVMSTELKCEATLHIGAATRTRPVSRPARMPYQRVAANIDAMSPTMPNSATLSRACQSPTPNRVYDSAVTHIWKGGFSKYLSAL